MFVTSAQRTLTQEKKAHSTVKLTLRRPEAPFELSCASFVLA